MQGPRRGQPGGPDSDGEVCLAADGAQRLADRILATAPDGGAALVPAIFPYLTAVFFGFGSGVIWQEGLTMPPDQNVSGTDPSLARSISRAHDTETPCSC